MQDFGTLSCWAINEIGEQSVSCLFQVVLAGNSRGVVEISLLLEKICVWDDMAAAARERERTLMIASFSHDD